MYLIKSFTLENSNSCIVCSFDLFIKEGAPILVESALDKGSCVVHSYDGYEDIFDRLWVLSTMCNGDRKVRGLIRSLHECLVDYRYGSR